MLSNLHLVDNFRSLTPETFSMEAKFGKRTIIYGHNGSGKSSLAELFYQMGNGIQSSHVDWFNEGGKVIRLAPSTRPQNIVISTFCKSWLEENVAEFLEGNSAAAIVTLGKTATDAKAEENRVRKRIKNLKEKEPLLIKAVTSTTEAVNLLVQSTQDAIVSDLGKFDPIVYTKTRYRRDRVAKLLAEHSSNFPTEEEHNANLETLNLSKPDRLELRSIPETNWEELISDVQALLSRDIQSETIPEILGNSTLQDWLETAIILHKDGSECQFCKNEISVERLKALRKHFDESRNKVKESVAQWRSEIKSLLHELDSWWSNLPNESSLYPEFSDDYESKIALELDAFNVHVSNLNTVDALLREKYESPERTDFQLKVSTPPVLGEAIGKTITKHNQLVLQDEQRKTTAAKAVLDYLIGSKATSFKTATKSAFDAKEELSTLQDQLQSLEVKLNQARAKQFSSIEMAEKISRDLEVVYGRDHLQVTLSPNGQNYQCLRGTQPAKNLSEGERNTLALIYFLRSLEDQKEQTPAVQRLVVIDDPSSSLDRESVFATHSWLLQSLQKFGQSIVLTHDFELLRLFLNSQKNIRAKSIGIIEDGKAPGASRNEKDRMHAEINFPRIAFLEMHAMPSHGKNRISSLKPLSETFLKFNSEYHFLFDRLLTGIENPDNHELVFLLPNAARRVLESFSAFHVPGRATFEQQLRKIALEDCGDEYRDVYDFCNRFSHGEGREPQLTLDSTAVYNNVKRCVELLKSSARPHYEQLCKAVGRKQTDPLTNELWVESSK